LFRSEISKLPRPRRRRCETDSVRSREGTHTFHRVPATARGPGTTTTDGRGFSVTMPKRVVKLALLRIEIHLLVAERERSRPRPDRRGRAVVPARSAAR